MSHEPTVHVIDDQDSVRRALGEMLSVFGYHVATHDSAESFLAGLDPSRIGCVVSDVRMPGMDGIELVRELGRRKAALTVILITGHADVPMAVAGIKAGAEDFIEKPVDDVQLVAAINRGLAQLYAKGQQQASHQDLSSRFERLTPREVEVFDLVVEGMTSQEIAGRLGIGVRTVEGYRVQVMDKMQSDSVAALVRLAARIGRLAP
jgi:two-component system response regulator FixJ